MTLAELRAKWSERDEQYSRRRSDLSDAAVEAVRAWRRHEVDDLHPADRARVWHEATDWVPPPVIRR